MEIYYIFYVMEIEKHEKYGKLIDIMLFNPKIIIFDLWDAGNAKFLGILKGLKNP